jgi:hypothetical protein
MRDEAGMMKPDFSGLSINLFDLLNRRRRGLGRV